MPSRKLSSLGLFALITTGLACSNQPDGSQKQELVVFHTTTVVMAMKADGTTTSSVRTKVENFYPAACFDSDSDDDSVPDELDNSSNASEDDSDGGVADDGGTGLRCKRCNRGPGTEGDFRLKVDGAQAELARGRVFARNATSTELTVPTPDGPLTIVVDAQTEVRDGEPLPGAEIRAEGRITSQSPLRITATRLTVLCRAPAPMPPEEVPPQAEPIPILD